MRSPRRRIDGVINLSASLFDRGYGVALEMGLADGPSQGRADHKHVTASLTRLGGWMAVVDGCWEQLSIS